jgi:carboxymethylenebutenolidase
MLTSCRFTIFTNKILSLKRLLLTFTLLCIFSLSNAWAQTDCNDGTAVEALSFSDFANDEKFMSSHLPPLPFDFEPKIGKMVSMKAEGGKEFRVFEVKSGKANGALIFMFHEWWGLNDYILREAEKLHIATGASVLAVDLYDRKVATNAEEASLLMQGVDPVRVEAIIKSCIDYGGKFSRIQTIGWCMGGGWSLQASILAGQQGYGCVIYYGMPEMEKEKLAQLGGPVLGIYASKDAWITPQLVDEFEENMKIVQKQFTKHSFDADHAFANPSNPKYNKVATAKANELVIKFLKENFNIPMRKPVLEKK